MLPAASIAILLIACTATTEPGGPQPLARIEFDRGSAVLDRVDRMLLAPAVAWAAAHPEAAIVVDGHADRGGEPPADVRLSLARAQAVREQLVAVGVNPDQIVVGAYRTDAASGTVAIWGTR